MSMTKANQKNWIWPSKQSEDSKNNYYQRLDRLDRIKKDKEENRKKVLEDSEMQEYIKYALESESKKNKNIKKYE
jgi:hypothetical protein